MTILLWDQFQNVSQWVAGNIMSADDPLGRYQKVATFSNPGKTPNLSKIIYNPGKTYTVSFDYLGLPNDIRAGVNLGCMVSINDGGVLSTRSMVYAGAITNSAPPMCATRIVQPSDCQDQCYGGYGTYPRYPYCLAWSDSNILFDKNNFIKLSDTQSWRHYTFTFTAVNEYIRIGLLDFIYADYPNQAYSQDCYFANFKVTDGQSDAEPVPIPTLVPSLEPAVLPIPTLSLEFLPKPSPEPVPILTLVPSPEPASIPAPMPSPRLSPAPISESEPTLLAVLTPEPVPVASPRSSPVPIPEPELTLLPVLAPEPVPVASPRPSPAPIPEPEPTLLPVLPPVPVPSLMPSPMPLSYKQEGNSTINVPPDLNSNSIIMIAGAVGVALLMAVGAGFFYCYFRNHQQHALAPVPEPVHVHEEEMQLVG